MIVNQKKAKAALRAGPFVAPVVPARDTSCTVLEPHEKDSRKISRVKPHSQARVPVGEGQATRIEQGCPRTEVLSLVMLGIAIVLLVQLGAVVWASNVYAWPRSAHQFAAPVQNVFQYLMFLGSGVVPLGLFITALLLVGKEYLVQSKAITLAVNVMASIGSIGLAVLCVLHMVSSAVFNDITRDGIVMRLLTN